MNSPVYRSIIDVLRTARTERGISQRELAQRLGKYPSVVNKIELFERRLDVMEMIAFARAMDMDPTALLERMLAAVPPDFELE